MLAIGRLFREPEREEEGSIIIAILIIVILSVSLTAVMRSVQGGMKLARTDQDRTSAFQQASGGMDQALYRLDKSGGNISAGVLPGTAVGSYVPTVVNGKVASWTEHVTAGGVDYEITATATPAGQTAEWRVQSVGRDKSGRLRQAVARIEAELLFKDGFFTVDGFYLSGNQHSPRAYDSTAYPTQFVSKLNPFQGPDDREASIGTNGSFDLSGLQSGERENFVERWAGFNMYGRATQSAADAACDGCSAAGGTVRPFADQLKVLTTDAAVRPPAVVSCPRGGIFTGTVQPGDYVCTNVTFQGTVNVANTGTGRIRVWPKCRLYMDGAQVNLNQSPLKVQIYFLDPPNPPCSGTNDSGMCDAVVFGMLYVPGMTVQCNGSHQTFMYGAVMAQFYSGTGNQFEFYFDASSQRQLHTGKYRVFDWRECPTGVTNC
ncbi:MAG TPA: hypothetical protein VM030_09880 [Acidimicrobiales bacterium]|nr:hypothetical protein [Acidimicrobiales bacterium]